MTLEIREDLETFSVVQFFGEDMCEWVRQGVDAQEAVKAFCHYTNGPAAMIGIIKEVRIYNDSDKTVTLHWKDGKMIYPPELCKQ